MDTRTQSKTFHELSELYREMQLLRLKYDQIVDVCRKLAKSWPNRGSDGRLMKAKKMATTEKQAPDVDTNNSIATAPPQFCDSPDMKMLDKILKKAQQIKLVDEELPTRSTENSKKTRKLYHQPNPSTTNQNTCSIKCANSTQRQRSSKPSQKQHQIKKQSSVHSTTSRTKLIKPHLSPRDDLTTLPPVTIVRHSGPAQNTTDTRGQQDRREAIATTSSRTVSSIPSQPSQQLSTRNTSSRAIATTHTGCQGEKEEQNEPQDFLLNRDGSKLRMSSKYSDLRNTFFRMQEHVSLQATNPTTEAMRRHFVNRLLPQGTQLPTEVLQLQLAKLEYTLLTEEVSNLSLQNLTADSTQDVTSARVKLESIINRAKSVEEKLTRDQTKPVISPRACGLDPHIATRINTERIDMTYGAAQQSHTSPSDNNSDVLTATDCLLPLAYTSLSELLTLVELEHKYRMLRIEIQLLKFCTEVILPKYNLSPDKEMSTTCVQILSELTGQPKPIFVAKDHHH